MIKVTKRVVLELNLTHEDALKLCHDLNTYVSSGALASGITQDFADVLKANLNGH